MKGENSARKVCLGGGGKKNANLRCGGKGGRRLVLRGKCKPKERKHVGCSHFVSGETEGAVTSTFTMKGKASQRKRHKKGEGGGEEGYFLASTLRQSHAHFCWETKSQKGKKLSKPTWEEKRKHYLAPLAGEHDYCFSGRLPRGGREKN